MADNRRRRPDRRPGRRPLRRRRPGTKSLTGPWLALLAPLAAVGLLVAIAALTPEDPPVKAGGSAADFVLPDTDGGTIALAEVLAEGDALLYFSMGVGCDGCFLQIPEIADELDRRDITLVPIMVDRPDWLAGEAHRLGVHSPIAIDGDRSVSAAFGMLGQYGHGDVPSHSFALVRSDGEIVWTRHYAEMFVPADRFFAELPA
jgi:peroxiredoxin